LEDSPPGEETLVMAETARRAALATLVVGGIVVLAVVLWKVRLVIALLFLAFTLAAAMRPGVEALNRRRVPRGLAVVIHYLALAALVALFLWFVVPRALNQVNAAIAGLPTTSSQLRHEASKSNGIKHQILVGLQKRLKHLPSAGKVVHPALQITLAAFESLVAMFFVLAAAAYWVFEREAAISLVTSVLKRPQRKKVRDTWILIDHKLGAYVRGQGILIVLVGTVLSLAFWAIGVPYWILIGSFAGIVEIIPVIGPLAAGALAVGVGYTASWHVALGAGIAVLVVRQLEDFLIAPRVLGGAVGLSPLVVMVSVFAMGFLFGGASVPLAIPLVAVIATLIDVIVRDKDPAAEEVPTVLFPAAKEAET
jgi:predicted PurR-regulated permease PerM